jgi:hypothetical protein
MRAQLWQNQGYLPNAFLYFLPQQFSLPRSKRKDTCTLVEVLICNENHIPACAPDPVSRTVDRINNPKHKSCFSNNEDFYLAVIITVT